jgi:hypothetical protein
MPTLRYGLLKKNINHRKIGGNYTAYFRGYARLGLSVYTEAVSYYLKIIPGNGKS